MEIVNRHLTKNILKFGNKPPMIGLRKPKSLRDYLVTYSVLKLNVHHLQIMKVHPIVDLDDKFFP